MEERGAEPIQIKLAKAAIAVIKGIVTPTPVKASIQYEECVQYTYGQRCYIKH